MPANLDWDHFTEVYGEVRKQPAQEQNHSRTYLGRSNISNHPEILLDLVDFDNRPVERTLYFDDYTELYHFLKKRKYIAESYHKFYEKYDLILKMINKDKDRHHYKLAVRIEEPEPISVPTLPYFGQFQTETNQLQTDKKASNVFRKARKPKI
jgi:hypothetical protein